ncbi:MAG: hypothetical protein R3F17_11700 [Planctomycetota bacterium]
MDVLRTLAKGGDFPPVLCVHPASAAEGESFFRHRWPKGRAIADPEAKLYAGFGLGRGSLGQLLGPRSALAGVRGLLSGHGVGRPRGDALLLSGSFLVTPREILWAEPHDYAGQRSDWPAAAQVWRTRAGT